MYHIYKRKENSIEYKVNFKIFDELLSSNEKRLAIISGTRNAVFKGKTAIIPSIFPGLSDKSFIKTTKQNEHNYVDIICNDETCKDWIIADFHGALDNNPTMQNLLKSMAFFSTFHILNVTLKDFNKNDGPSDEIQQILTMYTNSKFSTRVIVLIRDVDEIIESEYVMIDNNSDDDEEDNKIKNIINNISKHLNKLYKQVTAFDIKKLKESNSNDSNIEIDINNLVSNLNDSNSFQSISVLNCRQLPAVQKKIRTTITKCSNYLLLRSKSI